MKGLAAIILILCILVPTFLVLLPTSVSAQTGDSYEPDNSFSQFSSFAVTTALQSQTRSISPAGDYDYIRFQAVPGTYTFYTSSSIDTYGYLYNSAQSMLTYNDDSGGSLQFRITYTITTSGYYYLVVRGYSSSTTGPYTLYGSYTPNTPSPPIIIPPISGAGPIQVTEGAASSDGRYIYCLMTFSPLSGVMSTYTQNYLISTSYDFTVTPTQSVKLSNMGLMTTPNQQITQAAIGVSTNAAGIIIDALSYGLPVSSVLQSLFSASQVLSGPNNYGSTIEFRSAMYPANSQTFLVVYSRTAGSGSITLNVNGNMQYSMTPIGSGDFTALPPLNPQSSTYTITLP